MRVIFIEAEELVTDSIRKRLKEAKIQMDCLHEVDCAGEAPPGAFEAYGAILIGNVEQSDELVAQLRHDNKDVPIIVLSDCRAPELAIRCFSAGADDFILKPFNPHELKARINAISRRSVVEPDNIIQLGKLSVHMDGRDPEVDGERIKLSQREHAIFHYLVQHRGRVVTKESVYTAVYGMIDCEPFEKVIDVYICKLRKKLAAATDGQQFIETVYCRGYKLDQPENTVVQRLGRGGRRMITNEDIERSAA